MSKYTLSRNWKLLFTAFGSIWLIFAVYNLSGFESWDWGDGLAFLCELFLMGYYFGQLFDNLVINKDGFRYRSIGIVYSGKWSDVESFSERDYFWLGGAKREGVYISKAKLTSGKSWGMSNKIFIPLSQFAVQWRENRLGQEIREYLPQVQLEPRSKSL